MKAVLAIVFSIVSFIIISSIQIQAIGLSKVYSSNLAPTLISVAISTKLTVIGLALIGIIFSIMYSKSNGSKLKVVTKFALFLGIISILLSILPIHLFFDLLK